MDHPFGDARYIWSDDSDERPVNVYRTFYKRFDPPLVLADSSATAYVFASSRYELSIDDVVLNSGPAPSAKGRSAYDAVELTIFESKIEEISITVHFLGAPTFTGHSAHPGLLFRLGPVISDDSWMVNESRVWQDSARLSLQQGYCEIEDAAGRSSELSRSADSGLERAAVVVPLERAGLGDLEPSGLPTLSYPDDWQAGVALLGYGNVATDLALSGSPDTVDALAEQLQSERLLPLVSGAITVGAGGVLGKCLPKITVEPTAASANFWLLIDMGDSVAGSFDFELINSTGANRGAIIDIGYDELLRPGETPSGLRHYDAAYEMHYADRLILSGDEEDHFASFGSRAFRYVRLSIKNLRAPITLTGIGVHSTTYPAAPRGAFACSDPRLDRIYEIGRRTLELCLSDQFMDTPRRERAQWIADARIEAIGARYCFGDAALHRRFLRQTALSQYPDGRIDPVGPGEWNAIRPDTPIPGYVAIWILSVLDYHRMTGDGALLAEILPSVQRALAWLASHGAGEGGLLTGLPGWDFTDWAPGLDRGGAGTPAAVNLFYIMALRAGSRLGALMGDEAVAASSSTRAEMVSKAFDSSFWNPLRGVYVDSVDGGGEQSLAASQQVNSLALLSGVGGEARRRSVAERLLTDESLTQTGTPYFAYYLLAALAKYGYHDYALNFIRSRWGAMMDAGATTWWETWDGQQSRCHGWGIAPSIWMPQHVLGVTAAEPGFVTVTVAPKPCGLTWARGIVPIPQGDVVIAWQRSEATGRLTLDVTVPTGVLLRPILPCTPTDRLIIDGQSVAPDALIRRTRTEAELAVQPGSGYRFEVLPAGESEGGGSGMG